MKNLAVQRGNAGAQFRENLFECALQRAFEGASSGVFVPASAQPFSNCGHAHSALAAQAHSDAAIRQFAEKDGGFNPGNAHREINDAFAILFHGRAALQVLVRDPKPGQMPLLREPAKRRTEQHKP